MQEKIELLFHVDNKIAYKTLLELEMLTTESNALYDYFDRILQMISHEKTFIRVRGFRLICSLAKWDVENKINANIQFILQELEDSKGTSVRQCLEKINLLLLYKWELSDIVAKKLQNLNLSKYKDNMKSLIQKDIDGILENL